MAEAKAAVQVNLGVSPNGRQDPLPGDEGIAPSGLNTAPLAPSTALLDLGSAPLSPTMEVPAPTRQPDAWSKVRDLALKQLDRFVSLEPGVLRGDNPDAIHDMRVASRRLQQILDLSFPKPRSHEIRRLRRSIQHCRRALGDIRNCDVLLARVGILLKRKRSARREAWTAVQQFLQVRRSASFHKAVRKLSRVNLAIVYVNLKECVAQLGSPPVAMDALRTMPPHQGPSPGEFPERLVAALGGARKSFEEQIALSHRDPRGPVIHGARIATKRLRYLLEIIHAFEVPGSIEALTWLRELQQHLGDWHDLEVLEQMMIEMIARPDFMREQIPLAIQLEKLILRNREHKQEFQDRYFQMTRNSVELDRLKDWVGYLLESPSAGLAARI